MSEARGFLGAGDLYINLYEGDTPQGWVGPYEASKFQIKANSELKEQTSRGRNTYGHTIVSVPVPKPFDLEVEMTEMGKEGMALALMGTNQAISQAAGSMAEATVTLSSAASRVWTPVNALALGQAIVVTNDAGTVTYNEHEDYVLNRQLGWIRPVAGGDLAAGGMQVKVNGPVLAFTGNEMRGGTALAKRAKLRLDGINFADQSLSIVDVYEVTFNSDAAVDFLEDKFGTIPLKGRPVTPAGYTEPFKVTQRSA